MENRYLMGLIWAILLLYPSPIFAQADADTTSVDTSNANTLDDSTKNLQLKKLEAEVNKLLLEIQVGRTLWSRIPAFGTLITAVVAIIGLFVTIWIQFRQQAADRRQRIVEYRQNLDQKFAATVTNLGQESHSIQASAAVSLVTFLKTDYEDFHEQVFHILLANLKLIHDPVVMRLLVAGFEKSIRKLALKDRYADGIKNIDLTKAFLYRADLSELKLPELDIAFADARHANFRKAILFRAFGGEANLERAQFFGAEMDEARFQLANMTRANFNAARLVSANFNHATLNQAQFNRAKLQGAHFREAKLYGAKFDEANLSDTYFIKAHLDDKALRSIMRTATWRNAHFNEKDRNRLEMFSSSGSNARNQ